MRAGAQFIILICTPGAVGAGRRDADQIGASAPRSRPPHGARSVEQFSAAHDQHRTRTGIHWARTGEPPAAIGSLTARDATSARLTQRAAIRGQLCVDPDHRSLVPASLARIRRATGRVEHNRVMRQTARSTSSDRQFRRAEVTDRDDMPLELHDPRAGARRTEQASVRSASVSCTRPAEQRDAVSRAVARDKPGDIGGRPRDNRRRAGGRGRCRPSRVRDPARR